MIKKFREKAMKSASLYKGRRYNVPNFHKCPNPAKSATKPEIWFSKFFSSTPIPDLVFLVVCSIYKRNSRLYSVHRMVYFF